jgi:hypothetical protein
VNSEAYMLDQLHAYGLLQHYGMPTAIVDFTGDGGKAFTFAASGEASIGRIAQLTLPEVTRATVVDFSGHPWAQRAQLQAAFGLLIPDGAVDLKSELARSRLGLRWYEFPVSHDEHSYFNEKYRELMPWQDDPSAGFVRFHITEYVEAYGKLSPDLTDWLIERVPPAPYCYLTKSIEGSHVVVNFRSASDLVGYDENIEREYSRRYWSTDYPTCLGWDRMKGFCRPPLGQIVCDRRTCHTDLCDQIEGAPSAPAPQNEASR